MDGTFRAYYFPGTSLNFFFFFNFYLEIEIRRKLPKEKKKKEEEVSFTHFSPKGNILQN